MADTPKAPESWYRDRPRYVGNEQPREPVRAWASGQAGFQEMWIDRDRNGWLTLGFDRPVDDIQRELEDRFPDAGVVAVQVDWNLHRLRLLQDRIVDALMADNLAASVAVSIQQGAVEVGFGLLDERAADVLAPFDGEPICVTGTDPTQARVGPQVDGGDGWRLLAIDGSGRRPLVLDDGVSLPPPDGPELGFRTELATTPQQLVRIWETTRRAADTGLRPDAAIPKVDFETEVVVVGNDLENACPELIFGVVVEPGLANPDGEARLTVDRGIADTEVDCEDIGFALTWAIAVDRSLLPAPPFIIVGPGDLRVDVDLREPGAAIRDDATSGPRFPAGQVVTPAGPAFPWVIEPGFPAPLAVPLRCFAELGPLNGYRWAPVNPELGSGPPDEWLILERDGAIDVQLLLTVADDGDPSLDVTANGRTERYAVAGPSGDEAISC